MCSDLISYLNDSSSSMHKTAQRYINGGNQNVVHLQLIHNSIFAKKSLSNNDRELINEKTLNLFTSLTAKSIIVLLDKEQNGQNKSTPQIPKGIGKIQFFVKNRLGTFGHSIVYNNITNEFFDPNFGLIDSRGKTFSQTFEQILKVYSLFFKIERMYMIPY